jgi:hypothetical protein
MSALSVYGKIHLISRRLNVLQAPKGGIPFWAIAC